MKKMDAVWLLLLLYVASKSASGSASSSPPAAPDPSLGKPGRWLSTGVYWYCAPMADAQPLVEWFTLNQHGAHLAKLLGSNGADCAVVLFVVTDPVLWTLPGVAEEAPHGLDTTLDDLRPVSKMEEFFRKLGQTALDHIKAVDARIQQWLDSVLPHPAP